MTVLVTTIFVYSARVCSIPMGRRYRASAGAASRAKGLRVRKIITGAAAVLGLILTGVAPASAHHNVPEIDIEPGECEPTKLTATWPEEDHQVANAALVVKTA